MVMDHGSSLGYLCYPRQKLAGKLGNAEHVCAKDGIGNLPSIISFDLVRSLCKSVCSDRMTYSQYCVDTRAARGAR